MSSKTNEAKFQRDREVINAATDGPWAWAQPGQKENGFVVGCACPPASGLLVEPVNDLDEEDHPEIVDLVCELWAATVNYSDAEFITRARTRWPAALDEIERLQADLERIRREVNAACELGGDPAIKLVRVLAAMQGQSFADNKE